jgi:hypothetical protein
MNEMKVQDLADFHGVSLSAVHKWSEKTRQDKTTQALAGAEPAICELLADINKLAYIFDCQNLHGVEQERWCLVNRHPQTLFCTIFGAYGHPEQFHTEINMYSVDAEAKLRVLKNYLTKLVFDNK